MKDWTEEYIHKRENKEKNKDKKIASTGWKKSKSYRQADQTDEPRGKYDFRKPRNDAN